jgi:hypothetical protein
MPNDINTFPIQQFIESVKIADMTQQKSLVLDIKTARTLALTLGEVTAKLYQDYEKVLKNLNTTNDNNIEIKMDGGGFR